MLGRDFPARTFGIKAARENSLQKNWLTQTKTMRNTELRRILQFIRLDLQGSECRERKLMPSRLWSSLPSSRDALAANVAGARSGRSRPRRGVTRAARARPLAVITAHRIIETLSGMMPIAARVVMGKHHHAGAGIDQHRNDSGR